MSIYSVGVVNGPSKAALQAAVGNSREHQHVAFATDEGSFEAHVDACEDLGGNAPGVVIRGHIASGPYQGALGESPHRPQEHSSHWSRVLDVPVKGPSREWAVTARRID